MDKRTWIIIGVLVVGVGALLSVSIAQSKAGRVDYSGYEAAMVHEPNEDTGNFAENMDGSKDAPVIIYEYGDYQCDACAPMNPYINSLLEEYGDKVALVFRTTIMSYHQNGTAAATAANAAARQGYWKEYKDILFSNIYDWYESSANDRQLQYEEYFVRASEGKGDLAQFRTDMSDKNIQKKIAFDEAMAQKVGVEWTPSFYVEDELINNRGVTTEDFLDAMREAINKRLDEKGIKYEKKADDKKTDKTTQD